jgi:hypothetical protein
MEMRRPLSGLLAAILAAGMLTVLTPSSASACAAAMSKRQVFQDLKAGKDSGRAGNAETIALRTLNIEFEADKKIYEIGEIAAITATITRPAKEDPLNNGIPMDRPYVEPAPGVTVGVGLHVGRVFLPGAGITDDQGKVVIRIKIESYAPAGKWVDASAYAWKVIHQDVCFTVQEDGFTTSLKMFRTAPRR